TALGQIHGRQKERQQFAAYNKKIKTTGRKDIIEPISNDYLDLMEKHFNK
ncbi:MAG: hypothetical protein IT287_01455, partial [Bdellovibrionaceae bacterium]|nr:hypothetical protein [Pseudobdellovibrionaceae bacterium]